MDVPRTLSGSPCKLCSPEKTCRHHSGSKKSPKKSLSGSKSPKRRPSNTFTNLPCGVLLKIANELHPNDYFNLTLVSYEIDMCLSEGRYKTEKEEL